MPAFRPDARRLVESLDKRTNLAMTRVRSCRLEDVRWWSRFGDVIPDFAPRASIAICWLLRCGRGVLQADRVGSAGYELLEYSVWADQR